MSWLDTLEEIRKTDWSSASGTERIEKAHEVINISAYAGALVSLVPVPLSDLVLLLPVHTAMVMTVGHVFGRKLTDAEARRVALELGAVAGLTFAGGAAISALRKLLLPAIGGLLSVPATFALTWGLGRVAVEYFQNPSLSTDKVCSRIWSSRGSPARARARCSATSHGSRSPSPPIRWGSTFPGSRDSPRARFPPVSESARSPRLRPATAASCVSRLRSTC